MERKVSSIKCSLWNSPSSNIEVGIRMITCTKSMAREADFFFAFYQVERQWPKLPMVENTGRGGCGTKRNGFETKGCRFASSQLATTIQRYRLLGRGDFHSISHAHHYSTAGRYVLCIPWFSRVGSDDDADIREQATLLTTSKRIPLDMTQKL